MADPSPDLAAIALVARRVAESWNPDPARSPLENVDAFVSHWIPSLALLAPWADETARDRGLPPLAVVQARRSASQAVADYLAGAARRGQLDERLDVGDLAGAALIELEGLLRLLCGSPRLSAASAYSQVRARLAAELHPSGASGAS